jgi:glutamine phosphoribosylpyrophosphate amidotransferase
MYNEHRGDDGIGIIYKDDSSIIVQKYLQSMNELYYGELNKDKFTKTINVGSFTTKAHDKKKYKENQKVWSEESKSIINKASDFVLLHHRKATYGGKKIKNLHPITINNNLYIHNGTADIDSVKTWIKLHTDIEFKSETDTEILAIIYNTLKNRFDDKEKIEDTLFEMFPSGWGVLMEITPEGEITIIKDYTRDLWVYSSEDGITIMSEPTPLINKFDKLIKLDMGILKLDENIKGEDFTEECKGVIEDWKKSLKDGKESKSTKCDGCSRKGLNVLSTFHIDSFTGARKDYCFKCSVEKSKERENNKKLLTSRLYESCLVRI